MGMPPPTIIDPETERVQWWPYYPDGSARREHAEQIAKQQKRRVVHGDDVPAKDSPHLWLAANFQSLTHYARKLSMELRSRGYLLDPDFSLAQDPDAVEKMLRDPVLNFAVNFRKRLVSGREYYLEPKAERFRPYVEIFMDLLSRIQGFTHSRHVLSEAIFQGVAIGRYDGCVEYERLEGTKGHQYWWYPRRIVPIDKRRLRREYVITQQANGTVKYSYAWTIYNPEQNAWFVIQRPDWYFWFVYNDEEHRLGHGSGLYDTIYPSWYAKTMLRQYGLDFAARFAQPWIDIALSTEAGDADSIATRGEAYIEAIKAMRAGRVLYHDDRDRMELREVGGSSQNHILNMIGKLDEGIVQVCLANTLTTGTGQHGSRAQAEVHEGSQENAVFYDRMIFEEAHDTTLLEPLWRYNRRNLFELGFEDVPYYCPLKFRLAREQKYDPDEQTKILDLGLRSGVRIPEKVFYERFDIPEPQPGERILRAGGADPFSGPALGFEADVGDQRRAARFMSRTERMLL